MNKKNATRLGLFLTALLLLVCLFSCGDGVYEISRGYFEFSLATTSEKNEEADTIKINCEASCVVSLYEYTASIELLDHDGKTLLETDKRVVEGFLESNEKIEFSETVPYSTYKNCASVRLNIEGKSKKNPQDLLEDTFEVSFVSDGKIVATKEVMGGKCAKAPEISPEENRIFEGWYLDSSFSEKAKVENVKIYRNTTFYAKYTLDAGSVTNKITTDMLDSFVTIECTVYASSENGGGEYKTNGSGVIFYKDENHCYVLTNNHVISAGEGSVLVSCKIYDNLGREYRAQVYRRGTEYAKSSQYDLACLYFSSGDFELDAISVAKQNPYLASNVVAIGSPNGQVNSISYGAVEDFKRCSGEISLDFDVIYHTAPISNGSSGGALLNDKLELVGINYGGFGDKGEFGDGVAIPISKVREFLARYTSIILN